MKYGIVVCPKCRKAKAVNLDYKTTRCIRCNKVIQLNKIRITYRSDSQQQIRQAIGLINAKMPGNP
jgi:hypothetical protein